MTYIVSSGALNSTHSLTYSLECMLIALDNVVTVVDAMK